MHSGFLLFAVIALCHIGVSFVINRVPYRNIAKIRPRMMPGNKECDFYKRGLHINAWKDYVPSVGPFDKKTLKANSAEYYSLFILETIRAEMAHVFCILITLLVLYLYKPSYPFAIPLFYLVINVPCIIIQRYNRARLERILHRLGSDLIVPAEPEFSGKFV